MAFPQNTQELDSLLGRMQWANAPKEEMQTVFDEFKKRQARQPQVPTQQKIELPTEQITWAGSTVAMPTASELPKIEPKPEREPFLQRAGEAGLKELETQNIEAQDIIGKIKSGETFPPVGFVQLLGKAARIGTSPITASSQALTPITEEFATQISNQTSEETKAQLTEGVKFVTENFQSFNEKLPPELQDTFSGIADTVIGLTRIAELAPFGAGAKGAVKVVEETVDVVGDVGKGAVKVVKEAGEATTKKIDDVFEAKRIAKQEQAGKDIESLTGKVLQGKKKDIDAAKRALGDLDTTDVKTFEELRTTVEDRVGVLAKKVDDRLSQDKTLYVPKDISIKTKVGKKTVTENPVEDSLNQLIETYQKAGDKVKAEKATQLRTKFNKEWLSLLEINNIAREHGREVAKGAFTKLWEPSTSISKQAFETTRKKVKEASRSKMTDDVAKGLDSTMSDLLNTNRSVIKMEEKVNALKQRVEKRGLGQIIGRKAADLFDIATLGTGKAFVGRLLPSNVWLKTLNALDLESQLGKNLNKLDELMKMTDDDLVKEINKIVPDSPKAFNTVEKPKPSKALTSTKKADKIGELNKKPVKTTTTSLEAEARKYKTAESFVESKDFFKLQEKADKLMDSANKDLKGGFFTSKKAQADFKEARGIRSFLSKKQHEAIELGKGNKLKLQEKNDIKLRKSDSSIDNLTSEDVSFLTKQSKKHNTFDEFLGQVRGSATQYGEYNPKLRKYLNVNSKRLDEIKGFEPDEYITVYRGIDEGAKEMKINNGDFVTMDFDDAKGYTSDASKVVSKEVKAKNLVTEYPEEIVVGEDIYELIYYPKSKDFVKITDTKLKEIYDKSK